MEMKKLVIVFILASIFIMPVAGLQKREQVPTISITTPQKGNLYVMGAQIVWLPFDWTLIIGPITIRVEVSGVEHPIVKFYIDGTQKFVDPLPPFEYPWWDLCFGRHVIKVELVDYGVEDSMRVFKIL